MDTNCDWNAGRNAEAEKRAPSGAPKPDRLGAGKVNANLDLSEFAALFALLWTAWSCLELPATHETNKTKQTAPIDGPLRRPPRRTARVANFKLIT